MIQTFSYLVDLDDRDFDTLAPQIRQFVAKMVRVHPGLRGLKLERLAEKHQTMRVSLRVAGLTRWHVQHDSPKILGVILRKFKIPIAAAQFEQLVTEHGRGYLKLGEGRTEMTRRPRAERMADGRPWDHIAWEGDDLPEETHT